MSDHETAAALPAHARIVIVGTGFAGLGMAIRLRQAGIQDFVILERADDVGGTWRANTYPGCKCDVPSNLYSFSFAPNPDWSHTFSPGPEIWEYLRRCAREHGVLEHVRFGHEMLSAAWDEESRRWEVETGHGTITADVVVSAVGGLSEPALPDIAGIERFQGAMFHSAEWDHDHDLAGERVAVIGTGASAIQFVPAIQPQVGRMHVFQRTPAWILPHPDRPVSAFERRLFRAFPPAQRLWRAASYLAREWVALGLTGRRRKLLELPERLARRHLSRQVRDPELRAKLTPRYQIGCKRILQSDDFYPALTRPNVELVTDRIAEIRERSIVTADGAEREVDTIIFGTGFHVSDMPVAGRVRGRDGRTLEEVWNGSPQAYLGTTIAGCPNLFMLLGPNTGLGHTSIVFMIESQIAYVMEALRAMDRHALATVEVRPEVQEAYNAELQAQMGGSVWTDGGCASWYIDANGRNTTLWPDFTFRYRRRTSRFALADYVARPRMPRRAAPVEPVAA